MLPCIKVRFNISLSKHSGVSISIFRVLSLEPK